MAVLSIQSHVSYGYAGNTAAVFPMQKLGREVWAVNTVEFSNHTGYGAWRGKVLGGELVEELVTGLEERGVLSGCEAVLSGYMGDATVANAIAGAVKRVQAAKASSLQPAKTPTVSPKALYCCDPVMGDVGRGIYVRPDIPDMFKNDLIPLADIVTPNEFELETLTGIKIQGLDDAKRAAAILHEKGPGIVLVTSYRGGESPVGGSPQIGMLVSDKTGYYLVKTPELPITTLLAGSGDLTSAVFLSRYLETGDVKKSLELCAASIFSILQVSWKAFLDAGATAKIMELRIIQAQNELDKPSLSFKACRV